MWDVANWDVVRELAMHDGSLMSVAYSPDGQFIVNTSWDNTARIWNGATGKTLHVLSGHVDVVNSAVYNPDGRLIVTVLSDGTARIWDTATGEMIRVISRNGAVTHAGFSPDGHVIVTAGASQPQPTPRIIPVDIRDSIAYMCARVMRDLTVAERTWYRIYDREPTCPQFAETMIAYTDLSRTMPVFNDVVTTPLPSTTTPNMMLMLPFWTPIASPMPSFDIDITLTPNMP